MTNKLVNTYYDVSKISIWSDAKINDDAKHKSRLSISFRNGMPRLTVYTGLEQPNGVISFPCDNQTFMMVLELLEKVASEPAGTSYEVDSEGMKYENGVRTNEKIVISTLHVGKTKEGVVYLAIIQEGKPKIVFPIKLSDFHKVRRGDNKEEVPTTELSERITLGIVRTLRAIVARTVIDYTNEEYATGVRKIGEIKSANRPSKEKSASSITELSEDVPF